MTDEFEASHLLAPSWQFAAVIARAAGRTANRRAISGSSMMDAGPVVGLLSVLAR